MRVCSCGKKRKMVMTYSEARKRYNYFYGQLDVVKPREETMYL